MAVSVESSPSVQPIRFGVMCSGRTFAAWEADCIRRLLAIDGVEPALLIVDDRPPAPRPGLGDRLSALCNPKTLLWRFYQRAILNRGSQSTRSIDLSLELADVPILLARPTQSGKYVQRFQPEEVAAIRQHDLHFIMRFAFNILRGDVLESARYGVWSFHHGDPEIYRGTPPGFWEIYRRDPVTGTVLQRLTERLDAGIMLHRGYFKTDPASYLRNRDNIFFGSADWPARLCRQIQAGQGAALNSEALTTKAPIYRAPNSLQMIGFLSRSGRAWIANQCRALFRIQQWSIGIINAPIEQVAGIVASTDRDQLIRSAKWLPEPTGRFLADPIAVESGEGLTILVEDYDWTTELGHIASIAVSEDGATGSPTTAIRLPTHLSYPFLLAMDDNLYCIPESSQSGSVSLFQASKDRTRWHPVAALIDDAIIDPTIFKHDGNWWLFGTRADGGDNYKLFAWFSDGLTGPWKPHPLNPLKTDIRSSRPAGPPFVVDGHLYRPAQDCSTGYGAAITVNRVTELTVDRFEEIAVSRIAPDQRGKYPTGLHTLCGVGGKTIIDGSRSAFDAQVSGRVLKRKFRRLLGRSRD